jgi:hypothetical protein
MTEKSRQSAAELLRLSCDTGAKFLKESIGPIVRLGIGG